MHTQPARPDRQKNWGFWVGWFALASGLYYKKLREREYEFIVKNLDAQNQILQKNGGKESVADLS